MNVNGQAPTSPQLPAALAANGGLKEEGVSGGVGVPVKQTVLPTWTEAVALAATSLALAGVSRTVFDARAYHAVRFMLQFARGGTTAISTTGVLMEIRAMGATTGWVHPVAAASFRSQLTAANQTTCATSDSNSGQNVLTVASGTGLAADQLIAIYDAAFTRFEVKRISKISGTTVTLASPLEYTHTSALADKVINFTDCFTAELPGGTQYEIIFDYGAMAGGDTAVVRCLAQYQSAFTS